LKNKVKLILGALFIVQCFFVFVNFVYLLANGGEMIVTEYNQKVLIFEVIANGFILIFSIMCGSWFIHEYIKEIKEGK